MTEPEPSSTAVKADVYYLRLRITNAGNERANNVEVFASRLEKKQADESFGDVDTFVPMNLQWSYHSRTIFLPAISPGTYKHCDIAHVVDPEKRQEFPMETPIEFEALSNRTVLSFDTITKPYIRSYIVPEGTYRLSIVVAAANAKPLTKRLKITLNGEWYDDENKMLSDGIGIRVL